MTTAPEPTLIELVRYDNWMTQQLLAICMDVDEGLLSAEMHAALPEIEALVGETIALVETHMPEVDTSAAKARLGWRVTPWQAPP